jgi:hypothetical protein
MIARFERGAWRKKDADKKDGGDPLAVTPKMYPKHWEYLQNFLCAEGMQVVSRNAIRDRSWSAARDAYKDPIVVNN